MIKISVIIVAYKNGDILKECLNRLHFFNNLGNMVEFIIIDNSPEIENVEKYVIDSKIENYIYKKENNRGFGAGNNVGAKIAKGEILAFINPDIYLVEPIFEKVIKVFENPNVKMCGCQLLKSDQSQGYSFYYDYEDTLNKRIKIKLFNKIGFFKKRIMFTSGSDLFIRKDAFIEVGMFDENIFMYCEEADIKKRILSIYPNGDYEFCKDIRMIHLYGSDSFDESRFRRMNDSWIYFGKKYNLDYKKKLKYEYKVHKIKSVFNRLLCKKADNHKYVEAYERLYGTIVCSK